ncbi:FAD-dependent monooxygenase [Aurantimonas sp. 22II-16-19i]|uniref:FAD binding domain-containing protein n=1 Tax=Aurantimonas sp. 22II-16-19i TaxID=1317114 RepID=UPI0009F7FA27|nr:FAD-dependent monooxygenase [Aurantimonas sp. 22II-16-19i]ORE90373.1 hypothetical protein ATO4_21627 [Aurantimonas sp. 22II-16-19i]
MSRLRIAIAGGALGGRFAAALLLRAGHAVTVFERSAGGLAGKGAGLVAQREVFRILRLLGCEHVAQIGILASERITFDRNGDIADVQATPQTQISWDRLYQAVREAVPDASYHGGRRIVAVEGDAAEARVFFDDGSALSADLVIGADGVGSIVRSFVAPEDHLPRYAGYAAWRGLVPERQIPRQASEALFGRFAFYHLPRSHILGYLVPGPNGETGPGERRYNWVWYRPIPTDELADVLTDREGRQHPFSLAPGQLPAHRRRRLVEDALRLLPPPFAAAVAAEEHPFLQPIFDYEAPRMVRSRTLILGDAAFVVRPHTAMGVSKAAGDAMALADALASMKLEAALASFEAERLSSGRAIAAYGQRLGASLG